MTWHQDLLSRIRICLCLIKTLQGENLQRLSPKPLGSIETINPKDAFTYSEAAAAIRNLLAASGLINE